MNILIIGNPISSGGQTAEKIEALTRILLARGHRVSSVLTRYAGHGTERCSRLVENLDRIVAVGGDGTLNEIVRGMLQGHCVPLLQLASGNANLLAKDLGLPRTAAAAARLVEAGRIIMADVGFMNQVPFLMVAGAGFDARVTEAIKQKRKGRVSNLSYVRPAIQAFRQPDPTLLVSIDSGPQKTAAMVVVSNVRNYAGLITLSPEADIASGTLNVTLLPTVNPFFLARFFGQAALGRPDRVPGVLAFKASQITITSNQKIPVQVDGDFAGRYPHVAIRVEKGRIPIVAP